MIGPEPPVPVTGDEASLSPYMTQEADPNTALRRTDSGGAIVRNLEVIDGILVVRGIRYTFPDTLEDNHFLQHTMDGELVWAPPEALLGSVDWNQIVNTPGSLSGYGIVPSTIDHGQISGLGDDDHTQYYRADGSRTLTGNANWGGFNLSAVGVLTVNNISASGVMTSTIVTGTPPFTIASTTLVTNLNADQLDSQHGAFYRDAGNLNAGTILSARLSGVYSGITGLGTQVQALDMGAKDIANVGNFFVADTFGVVVGHTAQIDFGATPEFQVLGTGTPDASMGFARFENNASGPDVRFLKSRGATIGTNVIVQSGDTIGRIRWQAADGGDFNTPAAEISVQIDGTPGLNDMPGRILFRTTPDGASSVITRIIVHAAGNTDFQGNAVAMGALTLSDNLDMGAKNITNAGAGTFAGTVTVANLKVSDTNAMGWVGHGGFESTSDGVFTLVNNARAIVGALSMGALTLSGNLDMGSNNITNVGTITAATGLFSAGLILNIVGGADSLIVAEGENATNAGFKIKSTSTDHWQIYQTLGAAGQQGTLQIRDLVAGVNAIQFAIGGLAATFPGAVSMGALVAATGEFSGNVGINESSPSRKLQVEGDGTANEIVAWFNNQGNFVTTVVLRTASRTGQWSIAGSIAGTAATGMLAGAMTFGHASGLSPIQFWNGNPASVKVTIMTGGNVLIGTTTDRGRLTVDGGGIVVGNPTGGDKGAGTMNVATDIFKNNTAYTNPDYVFELAHDRSARKIPYGYRIRNLEEIEAYTRAWYHLPGTHPNNPMGMFNRSDWLLEKVEETFLHLFAHQYRLSDFERRFKDHDSRIVRLENDNKELRELLNTQRN